MGSGGRAHGGKCAKKIDSASSLRHQLSNVCDGDQHHRFFDFQTDAFWAIFLSRLVLIPVVSGLSYELIRFSAPRCQKGFFRSILLRAGSSAHHNQRAVGRSAGSRYSCPERSPRPRRHQSSRSADRRLAGLPALSSRPISNFYSLDAL